MALASALGILMVLGLLMAGAVAASTRARRTARVADDEAGLSAAADDAAYGVLQGSTGGELADLPLGRATIYDISDPAARGVAARVAVTHLPADLLWIVADAIATPGFDAERRVNLVAAFPVAGRPAAAAIVSRGNVSLGPRVQFVPDAVGEADCATTGAPNLVIAPGASASAGPGLRIETRDAASDSSSYLLTARQLELLRGRPGVLYVAGDTTIADGAFDGILIVMGTLTITGPVSATGLVVAGWAVHAAGAALTLTGGLMAFAPPGAVGDTAADALVLTDGTIRYAPCVIARALRRAAPPKPLRDRGWIELF